MLRLPVLAVVAVLAGSIVPAGQPAVAAPTRGLVLERAVLVMRHGIRAPLDGEVPPGMAGGGEPDHAARRPCARTGRCV